jgi:glutamine amidotransferase-like uncharacterized protein
MTNLKTVQKKQQFDVFTTIQVPVSITVEADNYEQAEILASLQLHQDAIRQIMMTFITQKGEVILPTIHNWETESIEAIEKE